MPISETSDLIAEMSFPETGTSSSATEPETIQKSEQTSDEHLRLLVKRALCHSLIERLPMNALIEALQILTDIDEIYKIPSPPKKPVVPPKSIPVKFVRTEIRPVYPIEEDE